MTIKQTLLTAIFTVVFAALFVPNAGWAQNPPEEPVNLEETSLALDNQRLAPENVATMTATPITPAIPCPSCLKDAVGGTLDSTPVIDVQGAAAGSATKSNVGPSAQ